MRSRQRGDELQVEGAEASNDALCTPDEEKLLAGDQAVGTRGLQQESHRVIHQSSVPVQA